MIDTGFNCMRFQEGREQELKTEFIQVHPVLGFMALSFCYYMMGLFNYKPMLTDIAREPEKGGFHPFNPSTQSFQAIDWRTWDMTTPQLSAAIAFWSNIRKVMNEEPAQVQYVYETDISDGLGGWKRRQHIHTEFDNGKPLPKTIA